MRKASLTTVYDGLNALGRVPWQINSKVFDVAIHCWENNISLGDIPSRDDFEVPPMPTQPPRPHQRLDKESPEYKAHVEEYKTFRENFIRHRRWSQRNMVRYFSLYHD